MKNLYWLIGFLCLLTFPACDGDDDQDLAPNPSEDKVDPQIQIILPQANANYLVMGRVWLSAWVKDNRELKKIRIFKVDPSGARLVIYTKVIDNQADANGINLAEKISIPDNAVTGGYKLIIEAEDMQQNVNSASVNINIIAEDMDMLDFKTSLMATGWYEVLGGDDSEFDVVSFEFAFFNMLNQNQWDNIIVQAYVDEFADDFGQDKNLWVKWDTDKDGYLTYQEFRSGFEALKFFENWDTNRNERISEEELAEGIKVLWDVNKDDVVSKDEYKEKLIKYFILM